MHKMLLIFVLAIFVVGCQTMTKKEAAFQQALDAKSPNTLKEYVNDKTILRNLYQFENAVLYFSPKGHGYLWVEGTYVPEYFTWRIEKLEAMYELCLSHPDLFAALQSSRRVYGNKDQYCRPMSVFLSRVKEFRETDIFKLSSGRIPFIRKTPHHNLGELLELSYGK